MWKATLLFSVLIIVLTAETADSNQCLTTVEEVYPKRFVRTDEQYLNIQFETTRRVTQRLVTRIMKIFLQEVLGYSGINIVEREDDFNVSATFARLSDNLTNSRNSRIPESMVNMEVWIPPQIDKEHLLSKHDILEAGTITSPGHFGWFIPERLFKLNDSWLTFTIQETSARFDVDGANLKKIMNATMKSDKSYYCQESFCQAGMYIPPRCQPLKENSQPCALLLADYSDATKFIKDHIDHWKLYVKVAWVGPNLRQIVKSLTKNYLQLIQSTTVPDRSLVILHWTPSDIIPNQREFVNVDFPKCGSRGYLEGCVYETRKLEKYVWRELEFRAKLAVEAINRVHYTDIMYENLINKYNEKLVNQFNSFNKLSLIEQEVACDWLKENYNYTLSNWMPNDDDKNTLFIGGIFPMTGTLYTAKSIVLAAKMAKTAINRNNTILRDYNLKMLASDGQCKPESVLNSFIDYILHDYHAKMIGILGPACSETVEPLAGVSKHVHTVIMSYAAEGSSLSDRSRYPYFFRTIGENRQYKYVYLQLLKQLDWHRVAALSEDGLKYTEYISYMQDILRENGITFIANIKFPRDWQPEVITNYLQDLKQKRAKIIISDVYDEVARLIMCEALRLEMTAIQGYIWFLPPWLRNDWFNTDYYNSLGEKTPCSTDEMKKAVDGYLAISHANFAPDNSIMQEGITVRQWRDKYENFCASQNEITSPYAGYAYDAMWTYAIAADKLLKENQSYIFDLHTEHTVIRLTEIISKTDFNGVSGRIKFVEGASRFPVINIYQHLGGKNHIVGHFYPNISDTTNEVKGGILDLNVSSITWLFGEKPDDGTETLKSCYLSSIAEPLNVSCEIAMAIANGIGVFFIAIVIGLILLRVKQNYDNKLLKQETLMKSLGIDYLNKVNSLSLDKWEIPRDNVVINRKIGEGAFGTVYGGEAFIEGKGWLGVAIKTLKVGSNTEEKLNFLSEVEVMKKFDHKNVVKLIAVCIKNEPVLTIMEFMLYGDLKTYLLARRHLVKDKNYEDFDEISSKKLTAMALDVASGLCYLDQLKYVHRDVASRNCLINDLRTVKLADFGMTRLMYENDYYKFSRKAMLPVRWMAPESLELGLFSSASDIWSFGVLLYEIITFGSFPFQGMSNNQVLEYVKAGNFLAVPKGVKPQLEELMKACWSKNRETRPLASQIVTFLNNNSRIIEPNLDVPLASVQLEHTGQMEMRMDKPTKKFSFPWSGENDQSLPTNNVPLLEIKSSSSLNGENIDINVESAEPLLREKTNSTSSVSSDATARYINIGPGLTSAFLEVPNTNSTACSIPVSERKSLIPEPDDGNDASLFKDSA